MKTEIEGVGAAGGLGGTPPVCWYIDFGRYGQITMREDEAQRAADAGAIVWRYAPGTIMTSNFEGEALPTTDCESCDGTGDVHRYDGEYLGRCACVPNENKLTGERNERSE